jgi:hypothetical protein
MEHKPLDELKPIARLAKIPSKEETRRARLLRFAEVLEAHRGRTRLFRGLEYLKQDDLIDLRDENSPLSIAFADPVLRTQGLTSDKFSEAVAFFDLSSREAHHILCDCHYADSNVSSQIIAARVRAVAKQMSFRTIWKAVMKRFAPKSAG